MKKIISVFLIITCLFSVIFIPASYAQNIGDIIGEAYYTDSKAYIDDHSIAVYSIESKLAVSAENLKYYGFDISWNSQKRTINVFRNRDNLIERSSSVVLPYGKNIGDKALDIYHSDIAVFFDGVKVKSFNTDICTLIFFEDIIKAYSSEYKFDEQDNSFSIKLAARPTNDWMKRTGNMMLPFTKEQSKFINFIRKNGILDDSKSLYSYIISDDEESGVKCILTYFQFERRVVISLSLTTEIDRTDISLDLIPDSDGYCVFRADTVSGDSKAGFSASVLASELPETDKMPSFNVLHGSGEAKLLKGLQNVSKIYINLLTNITFSCLTDFSLDNIIQSN